MSIKSTILEKNTIGCKYSDKNTCYTTLSEKKNTYLKHLLVDSRFYIKIVEVFLHMFLTASVTYINSTLILVFYIYTKLSCLQKWYKGLS